MSSRSRRIQGLYLIVVGVAFAVRGAIALGDPDFLDANTAYDSGGGILIGATWAVFGLLVMTGRTEPASTKEELPPAEPEPA